MAAITLTITDDDKGGVTVAADFGERIDDDSLAHGMGQQLLQSILASAKTYSTVEDTAPEVNVEPSLVIVPGSITEN